MSAFINLLGFFSVSACLAMHWQKSLNHVLPIGTAVWLLLLYVLAFFRALYLIDLMALLCILFAAVLFFRRFGRAAPGEYLRLLFAPQSVSLFIVMLFAFVLMKDLLIRSADDLRCWALEVKSIEHFKGFAPQFLHATVDFGNYSPATTLFRWWCVHLLPDFTEGMIAVGSAWLFVLLLSPLFSCLRYGPLLSPVVGIFSAGLLLLLPGTLDSFCYQSVCAELVITSAFALCLSAGLSKSFSSAADTGCEASQRRYAHWLFAACFMLMAFFKHSGIGFAFSLLLLFLSVKKGGSPSDKGCTLLSLISSRRLAGIFVLSLLPALSWTIFCEFTSRSAYFSFSVPHSAGEGAALSALWESYGAGYLSSLFKAFFICPIHSGGVIVKLPIFTYLVLVFLLLLLLYRLGLIPKNTLSSLSVYVLVMASVLFAVLFVMHTFVFREAQYFAPETMVLSITRYGQPFLLGMLIFIAYMLISGSEGRGRLAFITLLCCFTISCCCLYTVYYRVISYEQSNLQARQARQASLDFFDPFVQARKSLPPDAARFLVVYQSEDISYFPQIPIQFLCAPDSLIIYEYDSAALSAESCAHELKSIVESHRPEYLFFMDVDGGLLQTLDPNARNGIMYPLD